MRVTHNINALSAWRHFTDVGSKAEKAIGRLSSGLRINGAADDPAGLGMTEGMRSRIRGAYQSMKNIQDGISLVRVAESALNEVSSMLQRGRELTLQAANGVLTDEERLHLQTEATNLLKEIDRVADDTEFNSRKLLGGGNGQTAAMVDSLRRSWLANAEALVLSQYGLQADDVSLKIVADETGPNPAYVSGTPDGTGRLTNMELHINLSMITNMELPDGGSYPQYADRVVGHEMVHAIMGRTMNFAALPNWFQEGAAEFLVGADERVSADLAAAGGIANLANEIDTFEGVSADYSAGYMAVKYIHQLVLNNGDVNGLRTVMDNLELNQGLVTAINNAAGTAYADINAFVADFKANIAAEAFMTPAALSDADVGAIGGGTAQSVVADTVTDTWNPLLHFNETWPDAQKADVEPVELFVGAGGGDQEIISLPSLNSGTYSLGLVGLDLVGEPMEALKLIDTAITKVSSLRSELGAIENRLHHTYTQQNIMAENVTAAESRIRDADMAHEMSTLTKNQIVGQAWVATMTQANNLHRDSLAKLLAAL